MMGDGDDQGRNLILLNPQTSVATHVLLTEFDGRSTSYRPRFLHFNLWPECEAQGP